MLTESDLRRLLGAGEQFDVEFMGEGNDSVDDRALVEAVVCLANGRGGVLLLGVEDDGRVTGARPRHGAYTDPRRVEALVGNQTVPSCATTCAVVALDGMDVVIVEVAPGRPITATSDGRYVRRAHDVHGRPRCLPFLPHELQSREATRGAVDHSALIVPDAHWRDLDPLEFERLRQTIARNAGRADGSLLTLADAEIARALGLVEGSGDALRVRLAGLLLLGREDALRRLVPTHEVAFQVLSGTRVAVNDFFRTPLVRVAEDIRARFDARNEEDEIAVGGVRVAVPNYSPGGFREALHNALVHRDYTRLGAVHVQWRDDEIEITNPGGFPNDVRLDRLLVLAPQPRNPVLADAFKRIGLVERSGRGIDTIYEGQLRYGRPAPDYTRSTGAAVQTVLPGGPANLALARLIVERDQPGRRVTVDEMLVLNAVAREQRVDPERAATLMQRSEHAAESVLERLVAAEVLEATTERRARIYQFAEGTTRALGTLGAYARGAGALSGLEPVDREQLILQYVETHGRITRSQAAELCQVEALEVRGTLERLVRRGDLVLRGERRGSYYERATPVMNTAP